MITTPTPSGQPGEGQDRQRKHHHLHLEHRRRPSPPPQPPPRHCHHRTRVRARRDAPLRGHRHCCTYYHQDHQGSTRLTTNSSGNAIARYAHDAYGTLTTNTAPTVPTPLLGYAGQYTDTETGFIYLRARYLDPTTGQFTAKDPLVGFTREPYRYVSSNPVNGADPTGLCGPFGDGACTPGGVAEDVREGLGICSDYVDESCDTVAEEHPEGAQAVADFAGGVLEVNPVTAFLPLDLEAHGVNTGSDAFRAGEVSMFIADLALGYSVTKSACSKEGLQISGTQFVRMHVDDSVHGFDSGRKIGRHLQFDFFDRAFKNSHRSYRVPIGSFLKDLF